MVTTVCCWSIQVEEDQVFVCLIRGGEKFVVYLLNLTDSSRLWKLRYQIALEHNTRNSFYSHQHYITTMMSLLHRTKLSRDWWIYICNNFHISIKSNKWQPGEETRRNVFILDKLQLRCSDLVCSDVLWFLSCDKCTNCKCLWTEASVKCKCSHSDVLLPSCMW